jgi:hypothetical protein
VMEGAVMEYTLLPLDLISVMIKEGTFSLVTTRIQPKT